MIKLLGAAAAVCLLAGTASAFDNSTCATFLTGGWNAQITVSEKVQYIHVDYTADGTAATRYDKMVDGALQPGKLIPVGKWLAKPGTSPDNCAFALVDDGGKEHWSELTVTDETTYVAKGTLYRRGQ
ncbi:hypothetical protein sos41_24500 [Alphaproteobacteria bacterium SO-S41]|nr:hypothetical protein sos41_24500 [Alphaproteobacteria bacterium SO-S41]